MLKQKIIFIALLIFIRIWLPAQKALAQIPADTSASVLANKVINANGGGEAFEQTKYIGWTFFDRRKLIWDKVHDRVRIDYITKPLTIITSLHADSTILFMNGAEITQPDSLKKYGAKGKIIWANDSYWLLMPFKLLDPGVHLKYLQDTLLQHVATAMLEMTFDEVGFTPENKYWIFIDRETFLITQWTFFDNYTDTVPAFSNTWGNYQKYGKLLLSGDRGEEGKLDAIHVWDALPASVFRDAVVDVY